MTNEATIPPDAKLGGAGVAFGDHDGTVWFYPAASEQPVNVHPPLLDAATHEEIARAVCPEQLDGAAVAYAIAIHYAKAGSGLGASEQLLLWMVLDTHHGITRNGVVRLKPERDAKLLEVALIKSQIFASFRFTGPNGDVVRRIAVSPGNRIRWTADTTNDGNLLDAGTLLADPDGNVVLSRPDELACVDALTGRPRWTAAVPKGSGGVVAECATHVVLEPYSAAGYGTGYAMFSKIDGTRTTRYQADAIALDSAKGWAVVSYPVKQPVSSNAATPDPKAPALEVLDLASGRPLFTLGKAKAGGLGDVRVVCAFGGHAIVAVADGLRAIIADTGAADPSAPPLPPQTFRARNLPIASRKRWVLLGATNGYGQFADLDNTPAFAGIVHSAAPLTHGDLPAVTPEE